MSTVINGRELADQMQAEIQKDVEKMTQQGIQPGLVVLLVGENPASQTYVRNKERAAAKIGILSKVEKLPESQMRISLWKIPQLFLRIKINILTE